MLSSAVIFAIFLIVNVSVPLLKAEVWRSRFSSHFKRYRRQHDSGWSWDYVDAFGITTNETKDRQEINKPLETVNIFPERIDMSPKVIQSIFSNNVKNSKESVVSREPIGIPKKIATGSQETNTSKDRKVKTESTEATTEEEENPCNRPDPTLPDFSAPGRRISEKKCYEYIWRIKERQIKQQNYDDCLQYKVKHSDFRLGYGGRPAKSGEFPHMGAIGWKSSQDDNWEFKCGGTLISPKFILTAAHCTKTSSRDRTVADPVPKIVRLGDITIINNGGGVETEEDVIFKTQRDVNIIKIIPHPKYKSPMKYFDIALMELEYEVVLNRNIQPACMWTRNDVSGLGTEATVTGWGATETSRSTSPILIAVLVDFIDFQQCDDLLEPLRFRHFTGLEDHQICAGKLAGGADACQGDSGGPLQVKIPLPESANTSMHYVIGVTSFGFGCALANKPGVYTKVSGFVDWIEDIVWR